MAVGLSLAQRVASACRFRVKIEVDCGHDAGLPRARPLSRERMSSTARQTAIAAEIGKYHVIAELARGGMGNVYLAALCGPGGFHKLLALKELKPELSEDETYVAMFLEEARLAARLVHPNIVQLNEVSSTGDRHYMAMEYLDGRSLSRIARRFGRDGGFPLAAHLRVVADALHGLDYAHELRGFTGEPFGIVHRDVSPLNLMVTFDGQVKLLDFGIAKTHDSSLDTKAGVLKGRVAYMAPEQASGGEVDRRADIYAVGVILWEAVAGRRLWPHMSEVEILSRVLHEEPPRLSRIAPDVPDELDAICARAMARDRKDRYATAAALREDLEAHIARRDDRLTMRQIGEAVGVMFAEERYKMNQVIEERLSRVQARSHSGVMPSFRTQISGTPSKAYPVESMPARVPEQIVLAPEIAYAPAIWSEAPAVAAKPETPRPAVPDAGGADRDAGDVHGARGSGDASRRREAWRSSSSLRRESGGDSPRPRRAGCRPAASPRGPPRCRPRRSPSRLRHGCP